MSDKALLNMALELIKVETEEDVFLYITDQIYADAFVIVPADQGVLIQHQYGCMACLTFEIRGWVYAWNGEAAKQVEEMLGCYPSLPSEIREATGLPVINVLDEALAELENGWYVMTNNCD